MPKKKEEEINIPKAGEKPEKAKPKKPTKTESTKESIIDKVKRTRTITSSQLGSFQEAAGSHVSVEVSKTDNGK